MVWYVQLCARVLERCEAGLGTVCELELVFFFFSCVVVVASGCSNGLTLTSSLHSSPLPPPLLRIPPSLSVGKTRA